MKKQEIIDEINKIIKLVNNWNHKYYVQNESEVEDFEYDNYMRKLAQMEKEANYYPIDSPLRCFNFNDHISSNLSLIHRKTPMLSLDSIYTINELEKFSNRVKKKIKDEKIEYICELKIDGLSASVIYKNGEISEVSTRGNGFIGEKITSNVWMLTDLPKTLENKDIKEVRGEIYMNNEEMFRLNNELSLSGKKLLSNSRNAASGTIRSLNLEKKRNLNFFAYQILEDKTIISQKESLEKLKTLGFKIPLFFEGKNIEEIKKIIERISFEKNKLNFMIDGVVIKVNQLNLHPILGETSRAPRWAIAYKFTSFESISEIIDIKAEVGKNGRISYVAVIKEIVLSGSKISNITLHNYQFIKKKKVNIGKKVLIKKAGDVIPNLKEVINPDGISWAPPNFCTSCNSELKWKDSKYQFCQNIDCKEKNLRYIIFFCSKQGINIKGLNRGWIEKLYNNKIINWKLSSIFSLEDKKEEIIALRGMSNLVFNKMIDSVNNSKFITFSTLLASLSIPLLGLTRAKNLLSIINEEEFIFNIKNKKWENFREIKGNKRTSEELENFFSNYRNMENFLFLEKIFLENKTQRDYKIT